ncbi:MAG TPA: GatB/YqeY domain-containing protein [Anaerolineales bacterium]|nr:GatB/YqeY domain-containing protein [Anaerolineales bacterium]
MSLKETLNGALKDAMRSGAEVKKTTLRLLMAAIRQGELEARMTAVKKLGSNPTDAQLKELETIALDDATVLGIIQKEAKSRREALAEAEKANRPDLVADNQAELEVLEAYLPKALTREELVELARAAIQEAGVTDLKGQGAVMKILSPRTKGRADGRLVNDVVRELLS